MNYKSIWQIFFTADIVRSAAPVQGETRRLDCQVIGWPVPDVIWLKDDVDITRDPRYRYTFDGEAGLVSLYIDNIQPSDSGWYTCVALNDHGSVVVRSLLVVRGPDGSVGTFADRSELDDAHVIEIAKQRRHSALAAYSADGQSAPRFVGTPRTKLVRYVGESLHIDYEIAGNPTPTISWLKNGKPLLPGGDESVVTYRFESENTRKRMVFDTLAVGDGGAYTVRLESTAGVAHHEFILEVRRREKPKFGGEEDVNASSQIFEVTEGDHVLITFQISGQPPPTVTWIKDGRQFTATTQRVKLASTEHSDEHQDVSFELAYAEHTDAGLYECIAENSEGRTHRKFQLIVKGVSLPRQFNDKEFKLVIDTQLADARTGELQSVAFSKGTVFFVKDGQSARNWLVAEFTDKESSQLLFIPPGLMAPVERTSTGHAQRRLSSTEQFRNEIVNFAKKSAENEAKKRNLVAEFSETEMEFIDELAGLSIDADDRLMAVHRRIAENVQQQATGDRHLDELLDELLSELFHSIMAKGPPNAESSTGEEVILYQLRSHATVGEKNLLNTVVSHLEYYDKCLQELSTLNSERAKESLTVVHRIIRFEKMLVDRPFMTKLAESNEAPTMAQVEASGRLIRHDPATVKGPGGYRCDDATVALFDQAIFVIANAKPYKGELPIENVIKLSELRITEFSDRALFINLQNQAGARWTLAFKNLQSYLCFLKELHDCGCLLALNNATSANSLWSLASSEDFYSAMNSADEYVTAQEESAPASDGENLADEEDHDDTATVKAYDTRASSVSPAPEPSFKPCFTCDPKQLVLLEGQASQVALSFIGQPKPQIQWLTAIDRKPVNIAGISAAEEGNLAILKVMDAKLSMTAKYICQLTNASGTSELPVEVEVKPNPELRRPRFVKQLSDTSVSEDGSLSLTTEYSSTESVTSVEWLLNGQAITTSTVKTVKITTTERSSSLSIEKVEKNFSGAVSCVITNEHGQATSTCGVSIRPSKSDAEKKQHEPISIVSDITEAEVVESDEFVWTCSVHAPEPFGISWSKVGEVVDAETLSRISQETVGKDIVVFRIKKVHITDAGTYRATLTYEEQVTSCEVVLGVRASDEPPEITDAPVIDRLGPNAIGLSWQKVVVREKTVTYTVEQTVLDTGEWSVSKSQVVETQCEVADLMPNLEYWFRVFAEDSEGRRGRPSPAVGYFTGEEVRIPEKPTNARLEQLTLNHWLMSWDAPQASGGEELTYIIEIYDSSQSNWRKLASGVQKTKIDLKQLKSDQTYLFRVRAVNSAGIGEPSDELSKPLEQPLDEEVPAPAKLMLVELSPTLVWLIWQPPIQADGLVYVIEAQDAIDGQWCRLGEHGVSETRIELNNLLENEEYKFRVRSYQESTGRLSSPSNEVCRPTKWMEPSPEQTPTEEQPPVSLVEQEIVTFKQEKIEITESGESVRTVTEEFVSESSSTIVHEQIVESPPKVQSPPPPLEPAVEEPAVVEPPPPPPLPAVPKNPKINYKAENVACLEWQSGEANGAIPSDVTFTVETKLKQDQWSTIVQNIKATNIDLKGLKVGRDYFFRIRAKGDNGLSEPSETVLCRLSPPPTQAPPPTPVEEAKTPITEAPKTVPSQPKVETVDAKSAKVSWSVSDEAAAAAEELTGYTIEALDKSSPDKTWKPVAQVTGRGVLTCTVHELEVAHEYEFRVAAINASGSGVPTQPIMWKAQVAPQVAPTHVTLEKVDSRSVKLSWDAVAEAQSYSVEVRDKTTKTSEWKKVAGEIVEQFATVHDLEISHEYEIRVAAVNQFGIGVPSQPVIRQAGIPPQKPPTELHLEEVDQSTVKITWKSVEEAASYRVELMDRSLKKAEWKKYEDVPELSAVVKDLDPAHDYELRVAAVSESGIGVPSQPVVRHGKKPPQQAPTELKLEEVDSKTAKLSWTPVEEAKSYAVEILDKSLKTAEWKKIEEVPELSALVKDLDPSHEYEVRVAAVSEAGVGVPSQPVVRHGKKPPQQAPTELKLEEVDSKTAKVTWTPVEEAKSYAVEILDKSLKTAEWKKIEEVPDLSTVVKDLDPSHDYEVRVAAVSEAGVGVPSQPVVRHAKKATHAAPSDLKLEEIDPKTAKVSWTPVEEAKSYAVEILDKSLKTAEWKKIEEVPDLSTVVKDLEPGHEYELRVAAVSEAGVGVPSQPVVRHARKPPQQPPTDLKLELVDPKTARVSWSPVEEATSYDVEVLDKSAKTPEWKKAVEHVVEMSATVGNLDPTHEYELRVAGVSEAGVGVPSQPIIRQGKKPPQQAPTDLKLEQVDPKTARVSWSPVQEATSYAVEVLDKSLKKAEWKKVADSAELTATVSNLDPSHDYEVRVAAVNEVGVGLPTQPIIRKARQPPHGAPTELSLENLSPQASKLKWSPLKEEADVSLYLIEAKSPVDKEWKQLGEAKGAASDSFEVADLKGDATYQFRVVPANEAGRGSPSAEVVRQPLTAPVDAPLEVKLTDVAEGTKAKVEWKKTAEATKGYSVQVLENGEWKERVRVAEGALSGELKDLDAFTEYSVRVAAVNEVGVGTASQPVIRQKKEQKKKSLKSVENVRLSDSTDTSCKLEWDKATVAGRAIIKYRIEMTKLDAEQWTLLYDNIEGTSQTISGLQSDADVAFRVVAIDDATKEAGPPSGEVVKMKPRPTLTAPMDLKIAQTGPLSAKLSWTSPQPDNKDIKFQVEQNSGAKWMILDDKYKDTSYNVKELSPESQYRFQVRVKASYGAGPPTDEVKFPVIPAKVQNLTFKQNGETSGELSWTFDESNEGENVSKFCIEVSAGTSNIFREVMNNISDTMIELTGLKSEQDYYFKVRALNPFGAYGPYSDEAHGKLSGCPPGKNCKPENVNATEVSPDSNKVLVAWSKLSPEALKNIVGYVIEVAPAGTTQWVKAGSTANSEATQVMVSDNVDREKDLIFRVIATNKYGNGPASDSKLLKKAAPKVAPADVQVAPGKDDKTATLTWKSLPSLLGCCYGVERRGLEGPDNEWKPVASDVTSSPYDIPGLQPESSYKFRVYAKNDSGRGPNSPEVTLASRVKPPSNIPVDLTVKPIDTTKAFLSWSNPQLSPGTTVTLENRQLPSGTFKTFASGLQGSNYEATALKPDCDYAFRARLQNSVGQLGQPSAEVLLGKRVKPDAVRGAPVLKELPTKGSYELSWPELPSIQGLEPPRYVIECSSSEFTPSRWAPISASSPIYKPPFQLHDLKPEHEYRYRIISENSYGPSEPSMEVVRKRKIQAAAPNRLSNRPLIDNDLGSSCRLSWVPPMGMPSDEPYWYQIERAGENSPNWDILARDYRTNEYQITGIKPEDYWRFRIRTCNRFGESEPSIEAVRDRLVDPVPPKRPRLQPTLSDIDDYSCQLTWPSLGGVSDSVTYTVERLSGSDSWSPVATDILDTNYTARDLNPEEEYWFRVRGKNRFGLGEPSPHAIRYRRYDPKPPKTISTAPLVTELKDSGVRLSWPSIRAPGPDVSYIIEMSDSDSPSNWRALPEIRESTYDIPDLPPNLEYYFRVRAKNKHGISEPSRESNRPRRYDSSAFKIPGQPQIFDLDDTSCRLSWRPLEIPDVLYRVESMDETQRDWSTWADRLNEPPYTIRDLKPDLDYRFRVRGFSDRYGIIGDASVEVLRYGPYSSDSKRPPRAPVGAPTLTEIDDTNYRLSWPTSREHGVRYIVEVFDSERVEWYRLCEENPDPWFELHDLKHDVDYRYRIRAHNRYGFSEPSLEAIRPKRSGDKLPPGPIPGIPTLLDLTDTSCRLMWLPVYGSKSSLSYTVEKMERDSWIAIATDITLTSYDVKDLSPDSEHFFRIRAKNAYGYSEPSTVVRRTANVNKAKEVAPRPVTSLPQIVEVNDSTIQLSWEPARLPSNAKQTRIFYVVEGYDSESSGWKILVDDLEDLLVQFDNLDCMKDYTFRIRAKNEYGTSDPSVPATRYKKRAAMRGTPSAPTSPALIEERGETSVYLSWVSPLYVTKAPSEYLFIIETRDEITLRWKTVVEQSELNLEIQDLSKDSDYWFRIRVKDVSSGLISGASPESCRRKKMKKHAPLILPNRPRITEIDDQTIRLSWASATARGVDDMKYIVEMLVVGTTDWVQVASGLTDNQKVVKDLDPSKSYSFRVKIESEYGISEPSTEVVLKQRKYGSDKMEIGLPPGSVTTKPLVSDFLNNKMVKLSWRPARSRQRQRYSDDEIIVYYTVQMCLIGSDTWETLVSNLTTTEYTLHDADISNNYQFRIIASNRFGASDPSPIASLIRGGDYPLQGGERHTYPELKCDKSTIYGVEGRTVTIAFGLTGNPSPTYKWYFNGETIDADARPEKYRTDFVENVVSLRIAFMCDKDVGNYSCSAWNVRGRTSVDVKLAMADPPIFLEPLRDLTLTLYGSGSLECRIDGQPYPEVRWYKDWKLVPASSRIKIRHWEPHLWSMNVNNSIHRDSGLYIVEAENVAGKIHCVANLKVEETPTQLLNIVFRPSNVEDYYHILEEIGRGSSAVIRRVIEKSTNHEYAAKFIRIFDDSLRSSLKSEAETIRWLHHRHIMHIEDAFETRKFLIIVCELITGGLMFEKIINDNNLTERDVASWVKQLLTVLAHIHEHKIVYLDLQPENIHICSPKHSAYTNDIKLIDFGWALKLQPGVEPISAHCNPEFSAPEVARSEPVTTAADIWSLGVLTYLMLTGESPLWAGNYEDSFKRLKSGELKLESPVLKELSQEACDFISRCVHLDPAQRPNAQQLLSHPFVGFAERLGKGTKLGVGKLREYTDRLMKAKNENKLNLTEIRRSEQRATSEHFSDARSRTPSPERPFLSPLSPGGASSTGAAAPVDADFWDDWMDQYVCGAAEDVKEKLKYYYYHTGQQPKITEGISKTNVKESMGDADWLQLALNLQNRLSRREAERRAADGKHPSFNVCINDGGYEVGRNYVLMARIDGRPQPVVTWYRNDEALHDGYRVATHASNESGHAWLTLLMAKPHDAAVYKCVARNSFGIARCRARVSEGDVPGAPSRPVISEISATEAFVLWDSPKDSGNIASRYYKVDYRDDKSEKWTCAGYVIDEAAYVSGLQPSTIYRFRVSCGNRINLGNYSYASIEVKTKESGSLSDSLSDDLRDAIVKTRQFSCPPIVEAMLRGKQFFEHSLTSVQRTAEYFSIIDPAPRRPLETQSGSDIFSMIASSDFKIGETLKRQIGLSLSTVVDAKTNQKLLLKQASKTSAAGLKLLHELEVLREIECNRIEFVRAAFETADELATISLPVNHDLDIVQHLCFKNKYSEEDVATVIRQLLDALHYMHKRRIVHSNINPRCVLVDDLLSLTIRLCGFDHASTMAIGTSDVQRTAYNKDDTDVDAMFCAPELFTSSKDASVSYQTDVWSVAAITFVLLSGEAPFSGNVESKVKQADWRSDDLYENTTKPAFKFLVQTLKALPLHRLTAEEAQEHKWLSMANDAVSNRSTIFFSTAKLRAYNNARK